MRISSQIKYNYIKWHKERRPTILISGSSLGHGTGDEVPKRQNFSIPPLGHTYYRSSAPLGQAPIAAYLRPSPLPLSVVGFNRGITGPWPAGSPGLTRGVSPMPRSVQARGSREFHTAPICALCLLYTVRDPSLTFVFVFFPSVRSNR